MKSKYSNQFHHRHRRAAMSKHGRSEVFMLLNYRTTAAFAFKAKLRTFAGV